MNELQTLDKIILAIHENPLLALILIILFKSEIGAILMAIWNKLSHTTPKNGYLTKKEFYAFTENHDSVHAKIGENIKEIKTDIKEIKTDIKDIYKGK